MRGLLVLGLLCVLCVAVAGLYADRRGGREVKRRQEKSGGWCGVDDGTTEQQRAFEDWVSKQIQNRKRAVISYLIRVVFTVIHRGEPLGTGSNIPDARIYEQIQVLNNDFRGNGTAGNTGLQFNLTRIRRINIVDQGWLDPPYEIDYIEGLIQPSTLYRPDYFFNMWSVSIVGTTLGFATFPNAPGIPGIVPATVSLTGGVTINSTVVGIPPRSTSIYNLGKTTTHEVGHFLGLRHIWGDGDCSATDYVADTPPASGPNYYCYAAGLRPNVSCPGQPDAMITNYMDYSPDRCLFVFTPGQIDRMQAVMTAAPTRASLAQVDIPPPGILDYVRIFASTGYRQCNTTIPVNYQLTNLLENEIVVQNITINWILDNSTLVLTEIFNGALLPGTSQVFASLVPTVANLSVGLHTLVGVIVSVNGNSTRGPRAPQTSLEFFRIDTEAARRRVVFETFEASFPPTGWFNDPIHPFGSFTVVQSDGTRGRVAGIDGYNNDRLSGTRPYLANFNAIFLPNTGKVISFDYAYALNTRIGVEESLNLYATNYCSDVDTLVWSATGSDLETSAPTQNFVPTSAGSWSNAAFVLRGAGDGQFVYFTFVFEAEGGNNLFIDNVRMYNAANTSLPSGFSSTPVPYFSGFVTSSGSKVAVNSYFDDLLSLFY
eukprot:TRINITY_DN4812_c0_g2_i1.p1 TRINITY_DN4812_c0_g2~~TRINITY_DN4812_c0_g2_i1.p1  ORF type:complete len:657 (-),score=100.71 TRINITY_DN4812_c0_g2_i1:104-2074(-)